jgi:hypothetical protein
LLGFLLLKDGRLEAGGGICREIQQIELREYGRCERGGQSVCSELQRFVPCTRIHRTHIDQIRKCSLEECIRYRHSDLPKLFELDVVMKQRSLAIQFGWLDARVWCVGTPAEEPLDPTT